MNKPVQLPKVSSVELLILAALNEDRYGLEIGPTVQRLTDGSHNISLGGLYTTLGRMQKKGLVVGVWGDQTQDEKGARRRYFRRTELGNQVIAVTQKALGDNRETRTEAAGDTIGLSRRRA